MFVWLNNLNGKDRNLLLVLVFLTFVTFIYLFSNFSDIASTVQKDIGFDSTSEELSLECRQDGIRFICESPIPIEEMDITKSFDVTLKTSHQLEATETVNIADIPLQEIDRIKLDRTKIIEFEIPLISYGSMEIKIGDKTKTINYFSYLAPDTTDSEKEAGDRLGLIKTETGWTQDYKIFSDHAVYNNNEIIFSADVDSPQNIDISLEFPADSTVQLGTFYKWANGMWVESDYVLYADSLTYFKQEFDWFERNKPQVKFNISVIGDNGYVGFMDPLISACGALSTADAVYTLTSSVSSTSTCFTIGADNITLDCDGYMINYSQSLAGYGINNTLGYDYITIKNCIIIQGNTSTEVSHAILFNNTAFYGVVQNNTIDTYGEDCIGVYTLNQSHNITILNNTIYTSSFYSAAISIINSDNSTTRNNTINANAGIAGYAYGIEIWKGNNNLIIENNITTNGNAADGIQSLDGENTIVRDNIVVTDNPWGTGSRGINVNDINAYIINNTVSTYGQAAAGLFLSGDNMIVISVTVNAYYLNTPDVKIGLSANNITLINVTYSDIEYSDTVSDIWRYWYLDVYVNDTTGSPVNQASVTARDVNDDQQFTELTASSGYIERKILLEYNQSGSSGYKSTERFGFETFYNNYTVSAKKTLYVEETEQVNLITNKQIYLTLQIAMPPDILFVPITPDDGNVISNDYVYVNVTATGTSDITAFIDWNYSLVGWWRFNDSSDLLDYSSYSNDGINSGSTYTSSGKFGGARDFDGMNDYVSVADSTSLDITDAITIEAWVNVQEFSRIQSILSKAAYSLKIGADKNAYFEISDGSETIVDVGQLGATNTRIYSLTVYNGTLYGGTYNSSKVYRYDGGTTWIDIGSLGTTNTYAYSLTVYNGILYGGTALSGKVYRYDGGTTWTDVGRLGTSDTVFSLAVYDGRLYGGTDNNGRVYRYDGGTTWTDVGQLGTTNDAVRSLAVYNGKLYAGTAYSGKAYRYDGGTTWTDIGRLGADTRVRTLVVYNGLLYGGTQPFGKVYRYDGGTTWTDVGLLGAGTSVFSLAVYDGRLYGGTDNNGRVYRYDGGTTWTDIGMLGTNTNVRSFAVYDGRLFAGTESSGRVYSIGNGLSIYSNDNLENEFTYIAATYDGTTAKLYLDGILENTITKTMTIDSNSLSLLIGSSYGSSQGGYSGSGEEYFNGTVDEVKIWNRALSPEEIKASYNIGLYGLATNYTGLADGTYTYTAYAQDLSGDVNLTETRTLTIYTGSLIITIESPENKTYNANVVYFNVTLNEAGLWCGYSLDGGPMLGMLNDSNTHFYISSSVLVDKQYSIFFNCTDLSAAMETSSTEYFTVDTTGPSIMIQSPSNSTYIVNPWFNVTLGEPGLSCSYSLDGALYVGMSNDSDIHFYNMSSVSDGPHSIRFSCTDLVLNTNTTDLVYFTVDTTGSQIIVNSPLDFSSYTTQIVLFNVTATDSSGVDWCGYSLNGSANVTMPAGSSDTFYFLNDTVNVGSYEVVFYCNDSNGVMNNTDPILFDVLYDCMFDTDCAVDNLCILNVCTPIICTDYCTNSTDLICNSACNGTNGCLFYDAAAMAACDGQPYEQWVDYGGGNLIKCCEGGPKISYDPDVTYAGFNPLTVELGDFADVAVSVRNRNDFEDTFTITLESTSNLQYWSWFSTHKNDEMRNRIEISFAPYEQKFISLRVLGATIGCFNGIDSLKVNATTSFGKSDVEYIDVCVSPMASGSIFNRNVPGLSGAGMILLVLISLVAYGLRLEERYKK